MHGLHLDESGAGKRASNFVRRIRSILKGELHSNYIFLYWPRIGFYNPIYKNELFFPSKTHISTSFGTRYVWLFIY